MILHQVSSWPGKTHAARAVGLLALSLHNIIATAKGLNLGKLDKSDLLGVAGPMHVLGARGQR